jgi:hypothetical protein
MLFPDLTAIPLTLALALEASERRRETSAFSSFCTGANPESRNIEVSRPALLN